MSLSMDMIPLDNLAACSSSGIEHEIRRSPVLCRAPAELRKGEPSHEKLQLRLYTTGAYAVTEQPEAPLNDGFDRGEYKKTQYRLFNPFDTHLRCIPWLSGPYGRIAHLLILVVAVICHCAARTASWNRQTWEALAQLDWDSAGQSYGIYQFAGASASSPSGFEYTQSWQETSTILIMEPRSHHCDHRSSNMHSSSAVCSL